MTDESQQPEPEGSTSAPTEPSSGDFTSGEGLVALAGMILLAVWVLFDVFLDEYGLGVLALLLAVTVVIVPRLDPDSVRKVAQVPVIMKVAGYALGVIGALSVIAALESGFYDDALPIIGALITYAAYAMAFMGARSVEV